jgi:hypothetical protein
MIVQVQDAMVMVHDDVSTNPLWSIHPFPCEEVAGKELAGKEVEH